jgi:hypothetical protein
LVAVAGAICPAVVAGFGGVAGVSVDAFVGVGVVVDVVGVVVDVVVVVVVAGVVGGGAAEVAAGVAVAEVAVARVGSAGSSVAIVTSYRMIDRNDHTWADRVCDMVCGCFP